MTLAETGHSTGRVSLAAVLGGEGGTAPDPGLTVPDIAERIVIGGWPSHLGLTPASRIRRSPRPPSMRTRRVQSSCAELVRPAIVEGRRVAALRLGDQRVMALLAAVVMFSHLPAGFANAQLRRHVAVLLEQPARGAHERAYDR